ncbi:hypothetical protein FHR72_001295 [Mycolicibacterium iranicum]|uniref:DUF3060 domain-containing protein n=2 Tax=Mycolicibacterium iranicum TaxID=912594 RepID=A0A839Q9E5_MYCIR|nr:hypothetical protein [Mycolicibacterium iranicum]
MTATAVGRVLAVGVLAVSATLTSMSPVAQAKNGDTHITGQGVVRTLDCNDSTLFVMGTGNQVFALGNCWAVTVQGSSNVVIADNVVNDITVYGFDQKVFYKNGSPFVWDRGRELGMTNQINRVPA